MNAGSAADRLRPRTDVRIAEVLERDVPEPCTDTVGLVV